MPSAKLRLPSRLKETLEKNGGLYGGVLSSLSELDPWISDNKLPFFPEYTDHGPDHINEVFVTAEALIRDEAWPHVTPEDVTVLVLGIVLHDCAMHLTKQGFVALLRQKEWAMPISPIDTVTWPALWDDFLREASRFDGKKLKKLFGDTKPVKPPPLDTLNLSDPDYLLIGEFLRRHHPRLAHEIALRGVPGPTSTPLKLQNIEAKLADLGGLVARSHGMPLRAAVDLLEDDERRHIKGVHVPFAMSVLRIADYLQIHAERAPGSLLQVKMLRSPVSRGEWKKHEAIVDINPYHDDPEALYVKARPTEGATYVGLKRLFASIQEELDDVWAVLGEVYGRVKNLRDFGIVIRRLRSNLDDEKAFAKTVDYVPGQAEFQAAGADLLKLLVGPLYGDRPQVGIRELLQNALDACWELEDYLKQHLGMPKPSLMQQEADVVIALAKDKDGVAWLTVSDRGIGMTPEVIKEYFLKAGASFRNSDAWQRQHTDKGGKSTVLRSGRFGVGVLAAFLLGERIQVSTRHVSQTRGVRFDASVDDEVIGLEFVDRPVGTSLRVRVSERTYNVLLEEDEKWDWYCLTHPSVVRKVQTSEGGERRLPQQKVFQAEHSADLRWRHLFSPDYSNVQWSYSNWLKLYRYTRFIVCNGIVVGTYGDRGYGSSRLNVSNDGGVRFSEPIVSVFDRDGKLPLDLQRSGLQAPPSFVDDMYDDICRDFIAYALLVAPALPVDDISSTFAYPGVWLHNAWKPVCVAQGGWSIVDPWHIRASNPRSILVTSHSRGARRYLRGGAGWLMTFSGDNTLRSYEWVVREMFGVQDRATEKGGDLPGPGPLAELHDISRRILVPKTIYDRVVRVGTIPRKHWSKYVKEEWSDDKWAIFAVGNCAGEASVLREIAGDAPPGERDSVAEMYIHGAKIDGSAPSRIARIWADTVKVPIIPFNLAERRRVLAHAYEKLAPYIAAHEELLKQGITKRPTPATDDEDRDDDA